MRHEILYLNSSRAYVLVGDTWYDTHVELNPQIGNSFLLGRIEKVLSYSEYSETFPESKDEIISFVNDKTQSGGFLRKVSTERQPDKSFQRFVRYGVNPEASIVLNDE